MFVCSVCLCEPHALCPITDPLHECKKLPNQLLKYGINRALWIGDYMICLEHVRIIYREHRRDCKPQATDDLLEEFL